MTEQTLMNADTYTNIQGLSSLKQQIKNNPELAKKEVSKQFEALLLQMLLKSMREGTRAISEESGENDHKDIYEDLFDNQLALSMSNSGVGLSELIEQSIDKAQGIKNASSANTIDDNKQTNLKQPEFSPPKKEKPSFTTPEGFMNTLFSLAKGAATFLGTDPKFLLAQAALETNWGKNIISHVTGQSSHNLFNIKADKHWAQSAVSAQTNEFEKEAKTTQVSQFRSYDSFAESFMDYVQFLKNNPRYKEALKHASDPKQFADSLQKANFATDPNYADKIMQVYNSKAFQKLFA